MPNDFAVALENAASRLGPCAGRVSYRSEVSSTNDVALQLAASGAPEGMTVVAGVPIDHGVVVGRPGARYGPRGIREASVLSRGAYEVSAENTLLDVETGVFKTPRAD